MAVSRASNYPMAPTNVVAAGSLPGVRPVAEPADSADPFADLDGQQAYSLPGLDGEGATLTLSVNGRRLTVERDDGERQVLEPPRASRLADVTASMFGEENDIDGFADDLRDWADAHREDRTLGVGD